MDNTMAEMLKVHEETVARQRKRDDPITKVTEAYEHDGVSIGIDVFIPNETAFPGLRPGILLFFGGGFMVGCRQALEPQAQEFARQGYVAITADYRITIIHQSEAADSVLDGVAAWQYMRDNASKWRLDTQRLAIGGGSAGGLIALMCGPLSGVFPKALVLFNPGIFSPTDTERREKYKIWENRFPFFSTESLKEGMPPMLIMHGEADTTVPLAGIKEFTDRALALGIDARLKSYPGVKHGFFNFNRSRPHYFMTLGESLLFLNEIL